MQALSNSVETLGGLCEDSVESPSYSGRICRDSVGASVEASVGTLWRLCEISVETL